MNLGDEAFEKLKKSNPIDITPIGPRSDLMDTMQEILKRVSAPKKVVRDKDGRVSHIETV